jgi:hypothetical protein
LNPLLEQTLESGISSDLAANGVELAASANGLVFLLITILGVAMAIVYIPVRLFLTITARSRRLKLLQRIRRLREEIGSPLKP